MDEQYILETNKEEKNNTTVIKSQSSSFKNSNSNNTKKIQELCQISLNNNQRKFVSNKYIETNIKNFVSSEIDEKKSSNNKNSQKTKSSHYSVSFDSKSDCFLFDNDNPFKKISLKLNNSFTKDSKEYYRKFFGKLIKIHQNNKYYELINKKIFEDNYKMPLNEDKNVKFGNIPSFQGSPSQNDFLTNQKISNSKEKSISHEGIDKIIIENNNSVKINENKENINNTNINNNNPIMNCFDIKNNLALPIKKNLYTTYFRNKINSDKVICKDIIKKLFINDKSQNKHNFSNLNNNYGNYSKQNINNNNTNHIFKKRAINPKINNSNVNKVKDSNIQFYYSKNNINIIVHGRNKTDPNYCYIKSNLFKSSQLNSFNPQKNNDSLQINGRYNYSKKIPKIFKSKNYNTISNNEVVFPINNFYFGQNKNIQSTIENKSRNSIQFLNKNSTYSSFNSQKRNNSNKYTNDTSNMLINSNNNSSKLFYQQFSNIFSQKNCKPFSSRNVSPFTYEDYKGVNYKKEQKNLDDKIKTIVINDKYFKNQNNENKVNKFNSLQNIKKNNISNKISFYHIRKGSNKNKKNLNEEELIEGDSKGWITNRLNNSDELHKKYFFMNDEDVVKYSIIKNNVFNIISRELSFELNNNKKIKNLKLNLRDAKKTKQMLNNNYKNNKNTNSTTNNNKSGSNAYIFKKNKTDKVIYKNENYRNSLKIYVKKPKQKI